MTATDLESFLDPGQEDWFWEREDARLRYQRHWLEENEANALLQELHHSPDWTQPRVFVYGREHATPRLVRWVGEASYAYSGLRHEPAPWPRALEQLRDRLEEELGRPFNGCLLNRYRDGVDAMGWHADDEGELGERPTVASLSLGVSRFFDLKPKQGSWDGLRWPLQHGSLLVMDGSTQEHWVHRVPVQKKVKGERINLTFRFIQGQEP